MSTPTILPTTGIMYGGTQFVINGAPSNSAFADTFPGSSLNGTLWSAVTSGTGTVTVSGKLVLSVPAGGGLAAIETVATYNNFDVTINYNFLPAIIAQVPTDPLTFIMLKVVLDSTDYFTIEQDWVPTVGNVIRSYIYISGTPTLLNSVPTSGSTNSFSVVRVNGTIEAYAGTTLISTYNGWTNSAVNIEIATSSSSATYSLVTNVTSYTPSILVTFGGVPVPFVTQTGSRIYGNTPPYPLPELVDVATYTINSTSDLGSVFTYTPPLQLTLTPQGQTAITIEVADDDTLRDTSTTLPGLRIY